MIKRRFVGLLLLLSVLLTTCFSGCAKVVRTETMVVEATVVDTHHQGAWMQPIWNGKFYSYIHHPARHNVTLRYKDCETTVNNEALYNQCKDNIGAIVKCNLVTIYYDDGTSKIKLKYEKD